MTSSNSLHSLDLEVLAGVVRMAAKAMAIVYAVTILALLFPIQFRQIGWIQALINGLLFNALVPLAAVVLVLLATIVAPASAPTRRLARFLIRWTLPVAVGFLLLVPLQGYVAWRTLTGQDAAAAAQASQVIRQFEQARSALEAVSEPAQLRALVGPSPVPQLQEILSLPLPQAREQLLDTLQERERQVSQQRREQRRRLRWSVGRETARNVVAALALALAFFSARGRRLRKVFSAPMPPAEMPAQT
jgi:hypothetical protein